MGYDAILATMFGNERHIIIITTSWHDEYEDVAGTFHFKWVHTSQI
jgi:hypothetical protein